MSLVSTKSWPEPECCDLALSAVSVALSSAYVYLGGANPQEKKRAHLQIGAGLAYTVDIPSALERSWPGGSWTVGERAELLVDPPSVRAGLCLDISTPAASLRVQPTPVTKAQERTLHGPRNEDRPVSMGSALWDRARPVKGRESSETAASSLARRRNKMRLCTRPIWVRRGVIR